MNYYQMSIIQLNQLLKSGELTSESLVIYFLNRIKDIDQGMIKYNSIRMVNQNAIAEAKHMDYLRSTGVDLGLMHGIPVILKDNIHTVGPLRTTAGTLAFKDYVASEDAEVVKSLKKNGAIILAKANLTEMANFMAQNMHNGYSAVGGKVLCAHDITTDPSGSSAGSAVSMSLGLAPLALGSETGGSIMSPSSKNGVVGIKPTMGLVSRTGIIPISSTLDTAGPIAKSVIDCAIGLDAMVSKDLEDPMTLSKSDKINLYSDAIFRNSKLKVGIVRRNQKNLNLFNQKTDEIKKALISFGYDVVDHITLEEPKEFFYIMLHEFKPTLEAYLSKYHQHSEIKTLLDLIRFNRVNQRQALKYGQYILQLSESYSKGDLLEPSYISAMTERHQLTNTVKSKMKEHELDLLIFDSYTSLGPCCGFPTMTIPLGLGNDQMPLATYMLADYYKEDNLIEAAYKLEEAIGLFVDPLTKK